MTCEIVAELSSNHLGSLDRALALIDAAADAGADAVKFQCWTPGTMAREPDKVIDSGPWVGKTHGQLYKECETPWEWFPVMIGHAKDRGIPWFSSVFDLQALGFLEGLGCPRYKISSFELTDLLLINACAKTGKPVVLSVGMAKVEEIWAAVQRVPLSKLTLLKCTSAYPAAVSDANLATMVAMSGWFTNRVGLSDHTRGTVVAVAAVALGAKMIEKHLTLNVADGGPDSSFSLEPHQFKNLVENCRDAEDAIGTVRYGPLPSEQYVGLRRTGAGGRG